MLEIIEGFIYPERKWRIDETAPPPRNGYNVAPSQQVSLIHLEQDDVELSTARWWLVPSRYKGSVKEWPYSTFNAKIESAYKLNSFREAWKSGRCLIPALGYYEWTGPKNNRQPWYIRVEQNMPYVLMAGLQTVTRDGLRTCTILTRPALPELTVYHDRMPVMLTPFEAERWLTYKDETAHILANHGLEVENRMLVSKVRKILPKDDGPELIEAIDDDF